MKPRLPIFLNNARRPAPLPARGAAPWLSVRNAAGAGPVELLIYDQIGRDWFDESGVSAAEFAATLQGIPKDRDILVLINSPGGNVWDGLAIYHQLAARRERVLIRVDGIAASIASIIALAGRELQMPANALMMIHDCSAVGVGNAAEMRALADKLDQHSDLLAGIYAAKTGQTREAMRAKMRAETWFSGRDAHAERLADTVSEEIKLAAHFDLSTFRHVPEALKPTALNPANSGAETPPDTMNRDQIIALLKKQGITVANDATLEQLTAQLETALAPKPSPAAPAALAPAAPPAPPTAPPAPANGNDSNIISLRAELATVTAALEAQRVARITASFEALVSENPHIDRATWLPRALKDEAVLNDLRKMPGAMAAPMGLVVAGDKSYLEQINAKKLGAERYDFIKAEFNELLASENAFRKFNPRAANTTSATLTTAMLAAGVTTILQNRLAPFRAFGRDFGTDPMKPKAVVVSEKVTAGGTVQTNATNFEDTTNFVTTNTAVSITPAQYTGGGHLTNAERQNGLKMERWITLKTAEFSDKLWDVVAALVTTANFTATPYVSAAAAFGIADLATLWGQAQKFPVKNAVMDGTYFARLFGENQFGFNNQTGDVTTVKAPGWDLIGYASKWDAAGANVKGLICSPTAIRLASGLPINSPSASRAGLQETTFTLPDIQLSVALYDWFALAGRVDWMTFDVVFGAAIDDGTAGILLKAA